MNFKLIISCLLIIFTNNFLFIVDARTECKHRDFGNGGTVCVCDATQCDDLDPLTIQPQGSLIIFESSKSGARFNETIAEFKESESAANATTITLDRSTTFQKIIGFGGAFTDSAGITIASLPEALGTNIIKDYFSNTGIEYNLARTTIGGSDFSTRTYSYDDLSWGEDKNLTKFKLQEEDLKYKIPYMILAQKYQTDYRIKIFGSIWSPPAWMKTNQALTNGGYLLGETGGEYYQILAKYFVKFIDEYKNNGVNIWGTTVQNEPSEGIKISGINSLAFTPEQHHEFVKQNLGPTLAKAGYGPENFKVLTVDDNRHTIKEYALPILRDPVAAKFVSGIAYHWYTTGHYDVLDEMHNLYPDQLLLPSEACEFVSSPHSIINWALGNWALGEKYAHDIIDNLLHYAAGWTDWNLALDMVGGPSWTPWSPPGLHASIHVNASAGEYYKDTKYYIIGHFSKFIQPDSVRIALNVTNNQVNNKFVAFRRPDNAVVLVAFNPHNASSLLRIDDPQNGQLLHEIPPHSLQTYIFK